MLDPKILDHLVEIARFHGLPADRQRLDYEYSVGAEPLTEIRFRRIVQDLGLVVSPRAISWRKLRGLGNAYPAILLLPSGASLLLSAFETVPETGDEAVVSARKNFETGQYLLEFVTQSNLRELKGGTVYLFKRASAETAGTGSFNLMWFVREALRQKAIFLQIILAALMIHATGLAVPLFFQIVVDKVLVFPT